MRNRVFILGGFLILAGLLVGLNLLSYTQRPATKDSEVSPNRSTYNNGPTGTLGLFLLLNETGSRALRWERPVSELALRRNDQVKVFVTIGPLKRDYSETEIDDLYKWVDRGGRLVVIDGPLQEMVGRLERGWNLRRSLRFMREPGTDEPASPEVRPSQPSYFLRGVTSVRLLTSPAGMFLDRNVSAEDGPTAYPDQKKGELPTDGPVELLMLESPVMVEWRRGTGSIIMVSDSYIVSNAGIRHSDNLTLALNLIRTENGAVVFDETRHGYGSDGNELLGYFANTPVLTMSLQVALIVALVLFSRSIRFAKALPEKAPDRLSKLEYVSAMAELQRQTRAYDLVMRNIYGGFRRKAARILGVEHENATPQLLSTLIAERTGGESSEILHVLSRAAEISDGSKARRREVLDLVKSIREVEKSLGG